MPRTGRPPVTIDENLAVPVSTRLTVERYQALMARYPGMSKGKALRRLVDELPAGTVEQARQEEARLRQELAALEKRRRSLEDEEREAELQAQHEAQTAAARQEAAAMRSRHQRELSGKITAWVNTAVADPDADPAAFVASLDVDPETKTELQRVAERALERRRQSA